MVSATVLAPSPLRLCCRELARPPATRGVTAAFSGRARRCRAAPSARPRSSSSSLVRVRRIFLHSEATTASAAPAPAASRPKNGNRGAKVALGALATLAAAAALAREAHLPDSFSEWDDQLRWEEVHELAQLSNMTHKDPQLVARWFDCHQYTGHLIVRDLPQVSNHYFVHVGHLPGEEHRRVHHVAIRGTVSFADLSIDLKTKQVFDEECGCVFHTGFKEVADAVVEDLEQFLEPGVEVKVAGHSLGGAAAVIVAAKLKLRGHKVGKVMTFGAPRVTDAAGAAKLKALLPVMRVTHERDPVPLTPLESGSRTSAAAAKLFTKPGGDQGESQEVEEFRGEQEEDEDEDEESWAVDDDEETLAAARGAAAAFATGARPVAEARSVTRRGIASATSQEVESDHGWEGREDENDRSGPVRGPDAGGAGKPWRVASSPVYAHFGSQVVLLRRKKCIECYREEIDATQSKLRRFMSSMSIPIGQRDKDGEGADCSHCPSRGKTFYDPKGEDGCLFDSPWLRLSHPNYTHRMNHYENEIAERLEHHLTRTRTTNAAPVAEAGAGSSPAPSLEETCVVGGRAAAVAAAAAAGKVVRAQEGGRASATELAEATAAGTATAVRCDAR